MTLHSLRVLSSVQNADSSNKAVSPVQACVDPAFYVTQRCQLGCLDAFKQQTIQKLCAIVFFFLKKKEIASADNARLPYRQDLRQCTAR